MLYGALHLRHGKDIDLLIHEASLEAADEILHRNGRVRYAPPLAATPRELKAYRIYRSHYEYAPAPGRPQVELHWRLHLNPLFGPASYPESGWQTFAFEPKIRVRTLGELDLVCYLCAHRSTHASSRLKWLVHIVAILRVNPARCASRCAFAFRIPVAVGSWVCGEVYTPRGWYLLSAFLCGRCSLWVFQEVENKMDRGKIVIRWKLGDAGDRMVFPLPLI
jgi:hypothetical protein